MLVQIYVYETRGNLNAKCYVLIREDGFVASYHSIVTPCLDRIKYHKATDVESLFLLKGVKAELVQTLPESEVLDYIKFLEMIGK